MKGRSRKFFLKELVLLVLFAIYTPDLISANFYWVGGSGNWTSYATRWATSSGGGTFHTNVPTASDNVFFDANSFSAGSQTVTINATANCLSIDWTGATNTPTFAGSSDINIYGSLTFIAGMNLTASGYFNFASTTTGNTLTSSGKSFIGQVRFIGVGGEWTLQDAFTSADNLELVAGTFNSNNFNITIPKLDCYDSYDYTRVLNLGSSTVTVTSANGDLWSVDFYGTNLTVNAGTSTIAFTNTNSQSVIDIDNSDKNRTLYNVTFASGAYVVDLETSGSSYTLTCNNLTFGAGNLVKFHTITSYVISTALTANGDCDNYIYFESTSLTGSRATLSSASNQTNLSNLIVKDLTSSGGGTFTADNSVNVVNNTGSWDFTNPKGARSLYWIGGTGNWGVGTNWSLSSGGGATTCAPTPLDDVYFDANSFSGSGQIVTLNNIKSSCANMDWTGATTTYTTPTLSGTSSKILSVHNNLTLISGMTYSHSGVLMFMATATGKKITTATKSIGGEIQFNGAGGGWHIEDNLDANSTIRINQGTFNAYSQADANVGFNRVRFIFWGVLYLGKQFF